MRAPGSRDAGNILLNPDVARTDIAKIPDIASTRGMNRRESIGLMGLALMQSAASVRAAPPNPSLPKAAEPLDTTSAQGIARVYRKLAWIAGEGFGIWWLKGRRYCAVPPTYLPFWDMLIGTLFEVRDVDAETYAVTTLTTTFYTDIATGALLETFHNPGTGKDQKVPYQTPHPSEQRYGVHGRMDEPAGIPGTVTTRSGEPGPIFIEGDDIWLRSDFSARALPSDTTRPAFQVEDLSTYFGSLQAVANPAARAVPAGQVFTDLLNYPAWLEMGDRNGHFFSRCFGRKVFSAAAMPADWRRLMAEHHPQLLEDPRGALRG